MCNHIDSSTVGENRHREMVDGSRPGRAVTHLARLCARQRHKFLQCPRRHRRIDNEDGRNGRQCGDGREIANGAVRNIRIDRDADRQGAGIAKHQHMTIGRCGGNHLGRNHAARARHIFNDERFAECLGQFLREQPGEHVGIAPGRRRGNQPDGGRWIEAGILGGHGNRQQQRKAETRPASSHEASLISDRNAHAAAPATGTKAARRRGARRRPACSSLGMTSRFQRSRPAR